MGPLKTTTGLFDSLTRTAGDASRALRWLYPKRKLDSTLASLRELRPSIDALLVDVESRFTACGSALQEQIILSRQLKEQCERLNSLESTSEHSALHRLSVLSEQQLEVAKGVARKAAELANILAEHGERTGLLVVEQRKLQPLFASLKPLRSCFRIEAATLPAELRGSFEAVTAEIGRLDEEIRTSFDMQMEQILAMHREVTSTTQALQRQSTELISVASVNSQRIHDALAKVEAEARQSQQLDALLANSSQHIDAHLDSVSIGLQYQDITRQKLEHVQAALADLDAEAAHGWGRAAARVGAICTVQTGQLDAIEAELASAGESVATGVSGIVAELQSVEAEGFSLEMHRTSAARMEELLRGIFADQYKLYLALTKAREDFSKAVDAARRFADARSISGAMRRLSADLKLMGLNAQVKSVQVNHGGLEVLSREASNISIQAGPGIHDFDEKLVGAAADLASKLDALCASPVQELDSHEECEIGAALKTELADRNAAVAAAGAALEQLTAYTPKLEASSDVAGIDLSPLGSVKALLIHLSDLIGDGALHEQAEHLHSLSDRYTMASERAVHEAALGTARSGLGGVRPLMPAAIGKNPSPTSGESRGYEKSGPSESNNVVRERPSAERQEDDPADNIDFF